MKTINPEDIKIHPLLSRLFRINQEVLDAITTHMKTHGYDHAHPVILAELDGELYCIDGYTRRQASIDAGIKEIPYVVQKVRSEEEALEESVRLQRDRRNMTNGDLYCLLEVVDKRRQAGRPKKELAGSWANLLAEDAAAEAQDTGMAKSKGGKSAAETAKLVGTTIHKVEQCRTVRAHGTPKIISDLKNDKISLNKAYNQTQKIRGKAPSKENPVQKATTLKEQKQPSLAGRVEPETEIPLAEDASPSGKAIQYYFMDYLITEEQHAALEKAGGPIHLHIGAAALMYLEALRHFNCFNAPVGVLAQRAFARYRNECLARVSCKQETAPQTEEGVENQEVRSDTAG